MSLLEEYGLQEDPRFIQARREAWRIVWLIVVQTLWVFGFAWWGLSQAPDEALRLWGIPAWYIGAFIGVAVFFPLAAIGLALTTQDCELE